jgi:hypothetical protein
LDEINLLQAIEDAKKVAAIFSARDEAEKSRVILKFANDVHQVSKLDLTRSFILSEVTIAQDSGRSILVF